MTERILIAGYYLAPINAIQQLIAETYKPEDIALLTHDDPRNQFLIQFAQTHGIEVQTFNIKSDDCYHWIWAGQFDYLLSLHFRHIIPKRVLDLFGGAAMNLHGGTLPKYRGCWSPSWAIINDEYDIDFTYHYILPAVDQGKIIHRDSVSVSTNDTAYSLYHSILNASMNDFLRAFRMLRDCVRGLPQQGEANYYSRAMPFDGQINPKWDYAKVDRFIRAMYFPPHKGAMLKLPDGTEKEVLSLEEYHHLCAES